MRSVINGALDSYRRNEQADVSVRCLGYRNWQLIANNLRSYSAATNVYRVLSASYPQYQFNVRSKEDV